MEYSCTQKKKIKKIQAYHIKSETERASNI